MSEPAAPAPDCSARTGACGRAQAGPFGCGSPGADFFEQSPEDTWGALFDAVSEAVRGICFDATCSLVAVDAHDRPVSLSPTG